jgi:hypothetical protein
MPNRFREFHVFMLHQKVDHIPAGPTAKAVKNLLIRIDNERRRLLVMKRAIRLEISPRTLKRKIKSDRLNNIRSVNDLGNNLIWDERHYRRLLKMLNTHQNHQYGF